MGVNYKIEYLFDCMKWVLKYGFIATDLIENYKLLHIDVNYGLVGFITSKGRKVFPHQCWVCQEREFVLAESETCIVYASECVIVGISRVNRKYATWVLLWWGIKFFIQRVLPPNIWLKNLGDKLKIRVEKVVFSFFPLKFDDVIKSYLILSTIIL